MNEKRERKSVFFAFSLLIHFLLITILLSLPAKIRNNETADDSRRVFIDFYIPASSVSKSSSKMKGKSNRLNKSVSKELIPANFISSEKMQKIKSKQKEEISISTNALNKKQSEIPVKFSLNVKNKNEIFGIQNVAFSGTGSPGILSPSGNSAENDMYGFGRGSGNAINGTGFSGRGDGEGTYYTNYYELCLQKIEEQKNYPDIAVVRQIEGAVDVKIALNPDGKVADISIINSSGWDMLDEEATRCVRRASPFPSPPEEILSDSKLILSFTIVFELS